MSGIGQEAIDRAIRELGLTSSRFVAGRRGFFGSKGWLRNLRCFVRWKIRIAKFACERN